MNNQTFYGSKWLDTLRKLTIRKTAKYTEILKTKEDRLEFLKIYLTFHKYQRKINAVHGSAIHVRRNSLEGPLVMFPETDSFQVLLLQEPNFCLSNSSISDLSCFPGRRVSTDISWM